MDQVVNLRPQYPLLFTVLFLFLSACGSGNNNGVQDKSGGPSADSANPSPSAQTLFTLVDPGQSGLDFVNVLEEDEHLNYVACTNCYSGGGVGIGDVNGDELPDVFMVSNLQQNKLYLNRGDMRFEDVTVESGIEDTLGWSNGVTMADVNGDDLLDIYVSRGLQFASPELRANRLYLNLGDGTFREAAAEFGIADAGFSVQSTFFDYDLDGDLDMYLINRPDVKLMEEYDPDKRLKAAQDPYVRDQLYRNENGTHFTNVSESAGIFNCAYGLSVTAADVNSDGLPDLFVANDFIEHDFLYINQGDGTFRDEIHDWMKHISNFSMGADAGDINNDGELDIYVVDMVAEDHYRNKVMMGAMSTELFNYSVHMGYHRQYMANMLHLNSGAGDFQEIAQMAGVSKTDWSWAVLMADLDLDGWKDFFVSNGTWRDSRHNDFVRQAKNRYFGNGRTADIKELFNLVKQTPQSPLLNYAFRNRGDLTFEKTQHEWGFETPSFSNGAAYADLDGDGDLDLVVNNLNDTAFVYRNNAVDSRRSDWLRVRLHGPELNTRGLGARIVLQQGDVEQTFEITQTRGYLSSVEPVATFGVDSGSVIDHVIVFWPGGEAQTLDRIDANQEIDISYAPDGSDELVQFRNKQQTPVILSEVPAADIGIDFEHRESDFDDFKDEILLPHRMSRHGPGIAVADVNDDGREDIWFGGAAGHAGRLYLQNGAGTFSACAVPDFERDASYEDMGALFFDADNDGDLDLYVVSGSSEFGEAAPELRDRFYRNNNGDLRRDRKALPKRQECGSCVVGGDFDGDGDIDLFVGGRSVPGHYPEAAQSSLLINDSGTFTDATDKLAPELQEVGMVTAALWTDFNNDGALDLIVVGEWMPIRVFRNYEGKLVDYSAHRPLNKQVGWWNSIAAGDFDNDGDIDYVVGNLGKNAKYKASPQKPLHVYYSDFDDNGSGDIVLAYYNSDQCYPVRGRQCSSEQMPFVAEKFKSYDAFAHANLEDVYGREALDKALHYTATEFRSCLLLNEDGRELELHPLPMAAQVAPTFGIVVEDVNLDGNSDIVLAGNLYSQETETIRYDASRGMVLLGRGDATFDVLSPRAGGLKLDSEVKSLAVLQASDGQTMLVAGVNSGPPRVFRMHNKGGRLLKLRPDEYAVQIVVNGKHKRVETHFGSGYLTAGSRSIRLPDEVDEVHIFSLSGPVRTLHFRDSDNGPGA